MEFTRRKPQTKQQRQVGVAAAVIAAASVGSSFIASSRHSGVHRGGDIGSTATLLLFATAVVLPVIIFLIVRAVRSGDESSATADDSNVDSNVESSGEENEGAPQRVMLIAVAAALIAIGIGLVAWMQTAK